MSLPYETFRCERHGFDVPILTPSEAEEFGLPVGCPGCVTRMSLRPGGAEMTGDDRAAEVTALLTEPCTVAFAVIQRRVSELVGRDVYTHELVNPGILAEEARDWQHPGDLEGHLLGTLRDAIGDKPITVVHIGGAS